MERSAGFGTEVCVATAGDIITPDPALHQESDRWTLFEILQMLAVKDNHKEAAEARHR